ncbi:Beta-hydroxyacyl-(acyl-carrier-protein) dehydratase [Alteracholeplasma palmae J233]|uniref:3-hydroxyacyl-[acyl-carrier-protein] dehydratase n=1 Tax=Alteracholeplasma palmae (strain ATCC 49389 / J233) TaxID=1318466 RepID=U4KLF8_ALTPJ|nr:3-hydroxyacyl-ACP dehydratase FabZ [Alteracholeplasma palmae]CCV64667.1 Beta-hydroxyacyl-(acyl-carrier-protein) dehydratase [Alteracholeplasma palmae J233]
MTLNQEEIKKIIPHRDPFLLIDEIIELEGTRAVGIKRLTKDEFYFKGHFPELPVMPGVLIIESLAQVGAVILLSKEEYKGKIAFFAGIKEAKFRKSVLPGDELRLECELIKLRGSFGVGAAKAYVGENLVCEATISFAIN